MDMEIKFTVPDAFIKEVLNNLPEAAQYSFECVYFNYKKCQFTLLDRETGIKYTLNLLTAQLGLIAFAHKLLKGELPGLDLRAGFLSDSSDWNVEVIDAYLQCCLLGDVIYG